MPELLDRKVRLLVPLLPVRGREAALAAAELASEIEWAKARLVKPDGYEAAVTLAGAHHAPPAGRGRRRSTRDYEREKRKRGLVDFDDLIIGCADALERDAEFAAAQRWRFRHLFVDEFQDASPAQFRLLRAWLGDRTDLCVVGDPDQAIYGFAGADAVVPRRLPPRTSRRSASPTVGVVQLGSNYRSTPQVVAAAGAVLGPPGRRRPQVHAARPDGPLPTFTAYDTADDEARGVARALRGAESAQLPWSRMAVLYRVNAQSALFEEALDPRPASRSACAAAGGSSTAGGAGRARRACAAAAREAPQPPVRRAPHRLADRHRRRAARRGAARARRRAGAARARVPRGRRRPRQRRRLPRVPADLAARRRRRRQSRATRVELLTFHRAKGLEFDTVFVTGLERGLVPISHAKSSEALDEEQRLLYVALSRGRARAAPQLGARAHGGRPRRPPHAQHLDPTTTIASAPVPASRKHPRATPSPPHNGHVIVTRYSFILFAHLISLIFLAEGRW